MAEIDALGRAVEGKPGGLNWVRPLHSIVATFGPETEDPEVVPFEISGITAGNETRGHRFLAPAPFTVRRLADYMHKLEMAKVVLDAERRRDIISPKQRSSLSRKGSSLSRTPACSPKSPAWSNGRWC